jgi:hypothetical protein
VTLMRVGDAFERRTPHHRLVPSAASAQGRA